MDDTMHHACPDDMLAQAIELAGTDEVAAIAQIDALIAAHPADPRLHFLGGSLLAAQARYEEARAAMARSIEIAPDYAIARFQLGLLELSSGDAAAADVTLQPLVEAESEDALALFARGLRHLARDELALAADLLKEGMRRNHDHPLVSRDMALIVERIEESGEGRGEPQEEMSAAQMLLQQHAAKSTKH
jgi:tetratricopeptide (TPR) repeat protein